MQPAQVQGNRHMVDMQSAHALFSYMSVKEWNAVHKT